MNLSTKVALSSYRWSYRPDNNTLVHAVDSNYLYEIDLDRMKDHAEMLDWIWHIMEKPWGGHDVIADLMSALNVLFEVRSGKFERRKDIE